MADNVIDRLVVVLGLDPKQFGSKAQESQAKLEKFNATVKKLNVDESKLNETQKKAIDQLRQAAVQTERTRKEFGAAGAVGKEFWGVLEKGALSFGAALGLIGMADAAKDAFSTNAQLFRLSATLGMTAQQADAYGKAIKEGVGGSADEALNTVRSLNAEIARMKTGQGVNPGIIEAVGRAQQMTGMNLPNLYGGETVQEFLQALSPAIRKMGQVEANAVFGSFIDQGTLRFLGLSDADQAKARAEAEKNTQGAGDYSAANEADKALLQLADATKALRDQFALLAAPDLTAGIKNLVAWIKYLRDPTAPNAAADRDAAIRANDTDLYGVQGIHKIDAERIVSAMPGRKLTRTGPVGPIQWTHEQRVARAAQLLDEGEDENSVPGIIKAEEAAGREPGAQIPISPLGGGSDGGSVPDTLLDAIRDGGERSDSNAVSPKGARGRYQIMPANFAHLGVTDPTNDNQEREAARKLLAEEFAKYHDWALATAAYNEGDPSLDAQISQAKTQYGDKWRDHINSFLPAETQKYLPNVEARLPGGFGGLQGGTAGTTINNYGPVTIQAPTAGAGDTAAAWQNHWGQVAQSQGGTK